MEDKHIIFNETPEGVGSIMLNRPSALNALSHSMIRALSQQLTQWADAKHIQSVEIYSGNNRAFCAGGDIREIYIHRENAKTYFRDEYRLNSDIARYPKPYTAIIDGLVMGGGVGVSIYGSRRVVSERAVFAMPETGIGFFPDIGASYFLSRCPDHIGIYLGLTGARINASDMLDLGFADVFLGKERPHPTLERWRTEISHCFSGKSIEEIADHLSQKTSTWHQETLALLRTKSPTSLRITLEQLCKGKNMTFDQCLNMEYNLALHFAHHPDFFEGIRAAVIDKDHAPQWEPDTFEDYFEPYENMPPLDL